MFLCSVLCCAWISACASRETAVAEADDSRVSPADELYKSPVKLLLDREGRRLFVACEGTGEVLVVDTGERRVVDRIEVGRQPFGMALSADESRLYVSNRWDNELAVVDLGRKEVVQRWPTGDDPHELLLAADGRTLFMTLLGVNSLAEVDVESGQTVRYLSTGTGPFGLALGADGRRLYVSNQYSNPVPFRTPSILELTVVNAENRRVQERRELFSTVIAQGVATSPDGHFVATALELPKNLVPQTQLYQGWMVTFGIALSETRKRGRTAYLLIDEPNLYFADPYDLGFTPDGRYLYISSSGVDIVSVLDMEKVYELLEVEEGRMGISQKQIEAYARHLGLSNEYVVARIPTGANPKGLAVDPEGRWVYVANRLDDSVTIIDARQRQVAGTIDLGGPAETTARRRGARLFNYASIAFQRQLSCNTCHPENSVDGLSYDIAVDGGMGRNLVDNLSLRGIADTAPFKWTGKNPNLQRQEGPRAAQLFFRTHGFSPEENEEIVAFIESIPPRPNRNRSPEGKLNPFQKLGKQLFERTHDNGGHYIPVGNRCITCHPPPYGTDGKIHDVGVQNDHDLRGDFNTPHLINVYERPPYMHDGRCYSLEEIWTVYNPYDTHGVTNDMTKDQLNALIEYIKVL